MEGYEAKFMLAFLRHMFNNFFPESLILRCDGFYCSPHCPPALAAQYADIAAQAVGLPDLHVKWTLLREARSATLRQLYEQSPSSSAPPFFTRFCQQEWWESLHVPKPEVSAGPTEQRKRAHEPVSRCEEDPNTLLRFIKRRKLSAVGSSP